MVNLSETNRVIWFTRLKAQYILVLSLAEKIRLGPKEPIDVQLETLDKLGRAVADAKRALLYFKNTRDPAGTPPTPQGPPRSSA